MYEVVRIYGQTCTAWCPYYILNPVMCRFSFPLFYWQLNSHIFLFCVSLCSKNANVLLFITFKQFFSLKKGGEGGHVFLKSASEHYSAGHSRESLEKRESGTASIQNVTHAILSRYSPLILTNGNNSLIDSETRACWWIDKKNRK